MSGLISRASLLVLTLSFFGPAWAAVIETPGQGRRYSGVLYVGGWKCPPNDDITVRFDDGAPLRAASRLPRGDTAGVCGNGGANGYLLQFNFNLLGDGPHRVSVRQGGVQFAGSTFDVTTLGQTFLRGADGTYVLSDFPAAGQDTTVEWDQGTQNFVITGYDPGGSPPSCPTDGPIRDLTMDCSDLVYGYVSGAVVAGLTSTGEDAAICLTAPGLSVVCVIGPVLSRTTFELDAGNADGGPFVPLDPGSGGNIASAGQVLNFTVRVDGEVSVFNGFSYFVTEPLASQDLAAASSEARVADSLRQTVWALSGSVDAGTSRSDRDSGNEGAAAIGRALQAIRAEVR